MIDKLSLFSNVAVTNNPMENRIVITGDVIQSRSHGAHEWMPLLEHAITKYTGTFDIFRGDSFQAEVTADQVFESLFYLKSSLRQLEHMDVRIGIGVGKDRKSTRLNSSHVKISYAVFCLKEKNEKQD